MTGCALSLILKVRVFGKQERPISLTCLSSPIVSFPLGGVYVRNLAPARVSYRNDFLISYRVYKFACFSLSHEQHDNAILNWRKLCMRYPFQFTGRPISHQSECSFRVYMIPLRKFLPEWNFRSSTTTGVTQAGVTRAGMTFCAGEVSPARKSPRCHVNTPLTSWFFFLRPFGDL